MQYKRVHLIQEDKLLSVFFAILYMEINKDGSQLPIPYFVTASHGKIKKTFLLSSSNSKVH
jgi:hypothetical protein